MSEGNKKIIHYGPWYALCGVKNPNEITVYLVKQHLKINT